MQDDLRGHDRVADKALPSSLVDSLGMNVLNVFRRFESRLASGVADKADLL